MHPTLTSLLHSTALSGKVAAFDMDGTLLFGDLGETVFYLALASCAFGGSGRTIAADSVLSSRTLSLPPESEAAQVLTRYQALVQHGEWERAYRLTVEFLSTFDTAMIDQAVQRLLLQGLPATSLKIQIGAEVYTLPLEVVDDPEMGALLKACLEACARVVIVSASPQPIIEAYCRFHELPTGIALGAVTRDERRCQIPYGAGKVAALRELGLPMPTLAFGNSEGDYELLASAQYGFLRTAGDVRLFEKMNA